MTLENYISEAVSHGYGRRKWFPEKPDKDLIIEWLIDNDFREIDTNHQVLGQFDRIEKYVKNANDRVYFTGLYDPDRLGTHWIQFGDRNHIYTVNTEYNRNVATRVSFWAPYSVIDYGTTGKTRFFHDLEDLAYEVDKMFLK